MKQIDQHHLSFQTDHEHIHAFFQDLGLALNRIMELHSQDRYASCESAPMPFLPEPMESSVN